MSEDLTKRLNVRMSTDQFERAKYWAERRGISVNEYMNEALDLMIRRENMDYDLPTLEQQRLNQLVDEMKSMALTMTNLERVTVAGFESIIGLARGDNYLLDAEDGELA